MSRFIYFFGICIFFLSPFVFAEYEDEGEIIEEDEKPEMIDRVAGKRGRSKRSNMSQSAKYQRAQLPKWLKELDTLIMRRNLREASLLRITTRILNTDPNNAKALNALGVYYLRSGKNQLAKILFARGLKAHPKNSSLLGNLAIVSLKEDRKSEAIEALAKSLEYRYNNYASAANLGTLYMQAYEYDFALEYLSLAYSRAKRYLSASNYEVIKTGNNYAVALAWSGNFRKSENIFEELIENNSSSVLLLLNYAILLGKDLKKTKRAYTYLQKADLMDKSGRRGRQIKRLRNYFKNMKRGAAKAKMIYFAGF